MTLTHSISATIAESIVGRVDWNGWEGFCRCPGENLHTKPTSATDCKVVCEPVPKSDGVLRPGVYCFHASCADACEAASRTLRSQLGKRCPSSVPRTFAPPAPRPPKALPFDIEKLRRIAAKLDGADGEWFAERSPIRVDNRTPASFLHALYQPGEKVIIFDVYASQGQAVWTAKLPPFDAGELDEFCRGRKHGVWFLTNPVDGEYYPTDEPKPKQSRRSWKSVTAWRYLVLESDKAPKDLWLAALAQMPLPIAAITTSGGKSIHALVRMDAQSKEEWDERTARLKPILTVLGACGGALTAVRLSRLPCCERGETGGVQRLLYLDPRAARAPICERPVQ